MSKHCMHHIFNIQHICPPMNHTSNFSGTWEGRGSIFAIDEAGNITGPQTNNTPPIQIVPTTDSKFYKIITSRQDLNRIAVVDTQYDSCGRVIGYHLIVNGRTLSPESQRLSKLVPIQWDMHGNPTKLQGIGESVSYQETNVYRLTYDTLTKQ